jgi:hypothetical protein
MEVHVETLITSTVRSKLPEFIYNFSKSIIFFYNFLTPYFTPIEITFHVVLTLHFKIIAIKNSKEKTYRLLTGIIIISIKFKSDIVL